ncbi:MAG: RagB/SusD family nutrient uptake outer membrane protein [Bacteroidales bacterium]|nr:RagB/SusD family nutrient uptake outer membrane protein [Bacteroidales bacterium]
MHILFKCTFLQSCTEKFLELEQPITPTLETFYTDEITAFSGLVGCYNSLQMVNFGNMIKVDVRSDDTDVAGNPVGEDDPLSNELFANFQIYADNPYSSTIWNYCYKGINTVNKYIEGVSGLKLNDPQKQKLLKQYIAEATFIRAYYYFTLVKNFGGVPLITKSLDISEWYNQRRASETEVYSQIGIDLRSAIEEMSPRSSFNDSEAGRISKGAGMALLAKALITEAGTDASMTAKWQEALTLCNDIIDSDEYSLSTPFELIFTREEEFGPESVFEIVFEETILGEQDPYVHSQTPRIFFINGTPTELKIEYGFGIGGITENLANQFGWHQTDDSLTRVNLPDIRGIYTFWTRFDRFLDLIPVDNLALRPETKKPELLFDNANYYARKYNRTGISGGNWAGSGMNFMVIRYSEVILLAAEAAWYLGNEEYARKCVNDVRERAFRKAISENRISLEDITIKSSGTVLRDDIWQERRLELAGEGDRFYDLKRTGRLEAVS